MKVARPAGIRASADHDGRLVHLVLPLTKPRVLRKLLARRWQKARKSLKRCQEEFSEDTVHEFRVQVRRLLAVIELIGRFIPARRFAKLERCLKQYLDIFGDLRDTQVQLLDVERMRRRYTAARHFHLFLIEREQRLIRKTRKEIRSLRTKRLGKWLALCEQEVAAGLRKEGAEKAAEMLVRSVRKAFSRSCLLLPLVNPLDTGTIHRLRVAFKKFRYMVETLMKCLPAAPQRQLARMHAYQSMMGDIQDVEALSRAFEKFARRHGIAPELARPFQQALLRRRESLVRAYVAEADRLLEFLPAQGRRQESKKGSEFASSAGEPSSPA